LTNPTNRRLDFLCDTTLNGVTLPRITSLYSLMRLRKIGA